MIPADQLAILEQHARDCAPEECCGVLVGRRLATEDRVDTVVPTANGAPPSRRLTGFLIPPNELVAIQRAARSAGQSILGYYHSHPRGPAMPSRTDSDHAIGEVVTAILGLEGEADLRCFRAQVAAPATSRAMSWTPITVTVLPTEETR